MDSFVAKLCHHGMSPSCAVLACYWCGLETVVITVSCKADPVVVELPSMYCVSSEVVGVQGLDKRRAASLAADSCQQSMLACRVSAVTAWHGPSQSD